MTVDDLNKVVRKLIREVLGLPENSMRPANQQAPTGKKDESIGTVLITVLNSTGQDDRLLENEAVPSNNVLESIAGQRRFTASVQFFRQGAYTLAERLPTRLAFSRSVEKMQALGLGYIGASAAKDLTAVIDADWEQRAQIDLEFHVMAVETDSVPTYGTFPIETTVDSSTSSSEVTAP
jgi:hypothetical protein